MHRVIVTIFMLISCQATCQIPFLTLNNGLKVVVKEDHRAPVAICMIWYEVGAADEPKGLTGISHVLEHLMFKGTPQTPLGTFSQIIAATGGQDNALTADDYTLYYEKVPAQHIEQCFNLEADRMHHLLWNEHEFHKEMKVIFAERRFRMESNPRGFFLEKFLSTTHDTGRGPYPILGRIQDLKQLELKDIRTWYENYYIPNRATVIVVGDVNTAEMYALAKQYFGKIKKHAPNHQHRSKEKLPVSQHKSMVMHTPAKNPMTMIGYLVPTLKTVSRKHAMDPYVLEMIAGLLNMGNSARLTSLLNNKPIATQVEAFYNPYARFPTQFILFGTPDKAHTLHELNTGMEVELINLQRVSVSQKELSRVKNQMIALKMFEQDSLYNQAMELGLNQQTGEGYVERIQAITPQQIKEVALRYFQEKHQTKAQFYPELQIHSQGP